MALWTKRVGQFTIALAFIAVISAAISFYMWREMRKAGDDTKQLVKAAQDAVAIAKDTAERQLRAYVMVEGISASIKDGKVSVTATFKNAGQTPAYDLISEMYVIVGNPDGMSIKDVDTRKPVGPMFVGANMSVSHGGELDMSDIIDFVWSDPNATVIVRGTVTYRDIFGKLRKLTYKRRRTQVFADKWGMIVTPDGNENN